ncbi:sialate O-acetylesterase [Cohnella yongneupensis]|uniref:Sialate O-acetylesterase n=1 Tax=Cohnella yongneupensis TaxID=425006 RepID=A0ABW0R071_9BACL
MSDKLRVNALFTDHMVLQRERGVPVWGTGAEGAAVTVRCGEASAQAVVRNGEWKAELPPLQVGGPYELIIEASADRIVLRDVLVGDVWLAGGQSNMEWRLIDSADPQPEIASASLPNIRYYEVPRVAFDDGQQHAGAWTVCSPETAAQFTAVGYYFAKRLERSLDVPIGILGCNWGGTSATCWVPEESIASDPELRIYVDEYKDAIGKLNSDSAKQQADDYQAAVDGYISRQAAGHTGTELGDYPWPPPMNERSFLRPNGLYGTMLKPTAPYAIKGFIYYQGETDAGRASMYDRLMGILIDKWRGDWGDSTLPFLFVQLTGYGDGNDREHDAYNWPLLREAQQKVTEQVPNTAMAVILDCGEELDIHPKDKKSVGERLAGIALKEVYGQDVACYGPFYKELVIDGGKAIVHFEHTDGGLKSTEGDVLGFQIAGSDGRYADAVATIAGDTVELSSREVAAPVAVRYGWASFPIATLANGIGLPAAPFRTDRGQ